jgi:hypothetical protein
MLKHAFIKKFESGKSIQDEDEYNKSVWEGLFIVVVVFFAGVTTGFFLAHIIVKGAQG